MNDANPDKVWTFRELRAMVRTARVERDAARADADEADEQLTKLTEEKRLLGVLAEVESNRADAAEAGLATASATTLTEAADELRARAAIGRAHGFREEPMGFEYAADIVAARAVGVSDAAPDEPEKCSRCNGEGRTLLFSICPDCLGDGRGPVAAPNPEDPK